LNSIIERINSKLTKMKDKLNVYLAVGENGGDGESDARLLSDHQNFGKRHV